MTDKTQIADDLEAAAELLEAEKVRWCQGKLGGYVFGANNKPQLVSVCAVGAIAVVTRGLERFLQELDNDGGDIYFLKLDTVRFHAARNAISTHLEKQRLAEGDNAAEDWNDVPGRTRASVVDLFKTVAKDLRNQGAVDD